jgi:hypothetical protein
MELVLPAVLGVGAALATMGTFVLIRTALSRAQHGWAGRRERARAMRMPVVRMAPAARYMPPKQQRPPVGVMDPAVRATPVPSPEQIHWTRAVRGSGGAAVDDPGAIGGKDAGGGGAAVGGDAEMDVKGHDVGIASDQDELDTDLSDAAVVGAQNVYWRTNGSTDCTSCSSSRLRGATFCLRCGRRLA